MSKLKRRRRSPRKSETAPDTKPRTRTAKPRGEKPKPKPKPRKKARSEHFDEAEDKSTTLSAPITRVIHGVPCVYVEKGVTKNMGDYNSARVTVGIMLPIDHTEKDLERALDTYEVIDKEIVGILEAEVEELIDS